MKGAMTKEVKAMARKGENIYKRNDGRWEARYIAGHDENGRAIYKAVYAKTYKEAKEKKQNAMEELKKLDYPRQPKTGTLASVSEEWLSSHVKVWKTSTYARYQEKLNAYLLPEFGEKKLSDISTDDVDCFITKIQTIGLPDRKPVSAGTAGMVLTIFKALRLQALRSDQQVRFNPECIRIKRVGKQNLTVFTEKEEKKLVAYLMKDIDETDLGILTCLFTGIRVGDEHVIIGLNQLETA